MSRAFYNIPLAFMFIFPCVVSQKCADDNIRNAVDLSDGLTFHNGSITKDGVRFPPNYVFKRADVNGTVKSFACMCEVVTCVRKCCPFGSVINATTYKCVEAAEHDNITKFGLQVWYKNQHLVKTLDLTAKSGEIGVQFGRPVCAQGKGVYAESEQGFYFQEDGRLYVELEAGPKPFALRAADKYCLDTFLGEDGGRLDALVCFPSDSEEHHNYLLSCICMLVSCVFLLATLMVYGLLPELRNMHGRVLTGYLVCLLFGFLCMATVQALILAQANHHDVCVVMTFITYFSLMSSFFWLNVMCFDIWWTFSGKRGLSLEKLSTRGRFVAYCAYALGVPTAMTAALALVEFCAPRGRFTPRIRANGACFLDSTARLIYFYVPILALCLTNTMFFALTAIRIAAVNKQTAVLKSKESAHHNSHRGDKQRLVLYIKIFSVMGINWLLEVASAIWPEWSILWDITDTYNVLMGVTIFIIFVCKRKIFRLIKKRYGQLRGHTSLSSTQTATSRTLSQRDDLQMSSVKRTN